MGCLVEEAVKGAIVTIGDPNPSLVDKIIIGDDKIDQIFDEIETSCFMMLATQQPVARDLRLIACSIRIISDLERMGDLAINIAKASPAANEGKPLVASNILTQMGNAVTVMISDALQAFTKYDIAVAEGVEDQDEKIDGMYIELFQKLFDCGSEHEISSAIKSAFVGRYLERIADHCVTIAERVNFLVEGME
jgi:phosphate transport system protein